MNWLSEQPYRLFGSAALSGILVLVSTFNSPGQPRSADLKPTIILISIDGLRYDYLERFRPPALTELARNGVRAKWMIPSFPTKTFPNHYTIVTGLYPENHGLVENNVYDFGKVFTMSDRAEVQNPRWWGGEPIWVTAEKQGQRAAAYFWPGSEAKIGGVYASYWQTFNDRVPGAMRIDAVLEYLDKPVKERPTFVTTYFSTVDTVSHEFGPESAETKYAVLEVDALIERLMTGLRRRKIDDRVNVLIVSDHGMATYRARDAVFLDDHFDFEDAEQIVWTSEIVQIFPKPGKLETIYAKVKDLQRTTCRKKEDMPTRLNYSTGKRVAPIICSSDLGWQTTSRKRWSDWTRNIDDLDRPRGAHGHDNRYQEMQATFLAHGPAFKSGYVAEPFPNVDLYNLMCRILGLRPAENDGDLRRVSGMLR